MAWETAIGDLGVVLANDAYMTAWREARAAAYKVALPDVDFAAAIRDFCATLFEGAAEQLSGAGDAANAARILTDVLEAEIHAARLLAILGGFYSEEAAKPLIFGPTALAFSTMSTKFGEYCSDLAALGITRVTVTGTDVHHLDPDGDGIGCD